MQSLTKECYTKKTKDSLSEYRQAKQVIPLGVSSTIRFYDPYPIYITKAEGVQLTDLDGNEYIDFSMNYGAQMVGHAHPKVIATVKRQLEKGTLYTMPHPLTTQMAREIIKRFPIDKVRFTNSGTETTMHAIRLARGYTGRNKIIKLGGSYHGMHDYNLVKEGEYGKVVPDSKGIPSKTVDSLLIGTFNDIDSIKSLFKNNKNEIAGVIVEPVMMNMGIVLPEDDFLKKLQQICQKEGALLIFDEVKTGVKLSWGGACEYYDIEPDIVCLAKSIGGGLPVGAFGAKDEIMSVISSEGVKHGGTYSGNPLSIAAGVVTLRDILTKDIYKEVTRLNKRLTEGYSSIIKENTLPAHSLDAGACGTIHFCEDTIHNHKDFQNVNIEMHNAYRLGMLTEGIIPMPLYYTEQWTISVQHTEEEIDKHLQAFEKVAPKLK